MLENLDGSDIREEDYSNPGVAFERTQADLRIVHGFLAALALNIALVFIVLWGFYQWARREEGGPANVPAPITYSKPPAIPPPRLQADPVADYNQTAIDEQQRLNTYGWVDPRAGVVHIPIDRAMDLVLQRGLPLVQMPNPNPAAGPPGATRAQAHE